MFNGSLHFQFAYGFLFLPLLWLYLWYWYKQTRLQQDWRQQDISIADVDLTAHNHFYHPLADAWLAHKQHDTSAKKQLMPRAARSLWWQGFAISLLLLALTRPVLLGERLPDPPAERDIVFLVDTSVSMQLMDYELDGKPIRRMALLQKVLDDFASKMQGERLSVIVFAQTPYMLVPLSRDQQLVRRMLSRVTTTLAGRYSAIGEALLLALKEADKDSDRQQTFILFTDAQSSQGKVAARAAATLVARKGIPVFTVAIGSSSVQEDAAVQGGLYQEVNMDLLEAIARQTGGKSYQVHSSKAIQQVLQDISRQRQNLADPIPRYEQHQLYIYPLLAGLLSLLMYQILRLREGWQ